MPAHAGSACPSAHPGANSAAGAAAPHGAPGLASTAIDTPGGPVHRGVLDMVGRTPLLELTKLDAGPCRLFVKMECQNPAGSIKDRIGVSMIEAAERAGHIKHDPKNPPTIIEATAGNTGLGLALMAGQRGYKLIVVVPDKMSREKIMHLRAMGADVRMTRSDVTKGHPDYYQEVAARISKEIPNSFYINQFSNAANPAAHERGTGPEIEAQMRARRLRHGAFVVGVGSGGTRAGAGPYLKRAFPGSKVVLADPEGSILAPLVNEGKQVEAGSWLIEGMGEDFVPDICDLKIVDEAFHVSDAEAFLASRLLLEREGVLAGSSTGCLLHAALLYARRQKTPMNIVTFVCDGGAKYLSKMFNDFWMIDNGFIKRPVHGDLRDLIARRHIEREDFTLRPHDTMKVAMNTMKLYDVSQVAVVEPIPGRRDNGQANRVVGILDEGDLLLAIVGDEQAIERPVSDFMTRRLETIRPEAPVADLVPIFRADRVAIVVDAAGAYLGLITKIDLINYLRRRQAKP